MAQLLFEVIKLLFLSFRWSSGMMSFLISLIKVVFNLPSVYVL